jgi:DNA polymerase
MDARRLQYLKALDIDVWRRREGAEPVVEAKTGGVPAVHGVGTAVAPANLDWTALESAVRGCTLCELSTTRTQTVFGVGDRTAQWMVIGEAPGADEDREGEPFVGRAGQLLTSMLKAMGLKREQVFIANILKCRPPGNRDPKPEEVAHCMPYLQQQIELVNPRLILCVGRIAAQNLLKTDTPIGKLRGQVHRLPGTEWPVVVTYHPAYLLRSPGEKRKAWADLVFAMNTAEGLASA